MKTWFNVYLLFDMLMVLSLQVRCVVAEYKIQRITTTSRKSVVSRKSAYRSVKENLTPFSIVDR
jgi:hypothetical protein